MSMADVNFSAKDKNVLTPIEKTEKAQSQAAGFADATVYTISACIDGNLRTFQVYGPKNQ
jgi:hypothetical protein